MGLNSFKITLISPSDNFSYTGSIPVVIIGRSQKCDFVIPREDLSREHCLLEVINDKIFVTDLKSKNGVYVDGVRIEPHQKFLINEKSDVLLSQIYLLKFFPMAVEIKSRSDHFKDETKPQLLHSAQTKTIKLELEDKKTKKKVNRKTESNQDEKNRYIKVAAAGGVVLLYLIYKIFAE